MQTSLAAKAPFDILASIFEICAESDRKAPLRLGGVCKSWRFIVHGTPRLWRVISIGARCEYRKLYFDRSGSYKLHLYMDNPCDIDAIEDVTDRIECLETPHIVEDMPDLVFPALTFLCYYDSSPTKRTGESVNLSQITPSRFPNLRHLQIHHICTNSICDNLVLPLESLNLTVAEDSCRGGEGMLAACSASLITLRITRLFVKVFPRNSSITLPRLRHLQVDGWSKHGMGPPLNIYTPVLQVYIEGGEGQHPEEPMHRDLSSATHIRLKAQVVPFSSIPMPNVRVLQVKLDFFQFRISFHEFQRNPSLLPRLERLEFYSGWMEPEQIEEARQMLEESVWRGRPDVKPLTIVEEWIEDVSIRFIECEVCW